MQGRATGDGSRDVKARAPVPLGADTARTCSALRTCEEGPTGRGGKVEKG